MKGKERSISSIWWMNPTYLFVIIMGIVIGGAYLIPADSYISYYRVNKFIDDSNLWYCLLPSLCFVIGSAIATVTNKGIAASPIFYNTVMKRGTFVKACIYGLFIFTMFGYMVWFVLILKNGFSLNVFLDVIKGEPGAIYQIAENFKKLTGVTSFTNFGIPFIILSVYYQCYHKSKTFMWMIITVMLLTLFRSIFFSERLAILEVVIPALVIYLSVRNNNGHKIPLVRLYPVFAVAALVGFFALSEYFRSWLSFYIHVYPSFWEFMVTRFFGYYVTAMNTGSLYISQMGFQSIPVPYFTWEWIWKFPGVNANAYYSLFGIQPEAEMNGTLASMGNPEFNNPSGLLLPYHDYGLLGALIYWLFLGYFSGMLYMHFRKGHTFGLLLYPIWMLAVLETPRYLYFSSGRFFPCLAILILFTLVVHYNKKKMKSWQLAGVKGG